MTTIQININSAAYRSTHRPRELTPAQEAARIREYLYQMQAFAWTATYQQAQARLAELEAAA